MAVELYVLRGPGDDTAGPNENSITAIPIVNPMNVIKPAQQ